MNPIIRVDNLSKQYRLGVRRAPCDTLRETLTRAASYPLRRLRSREKPVPETMWALKDVSFEVQPGEVVGVIGRNGAGKSTLLKVLSRITEPTSGRVELRGRVASLLEVGTGFHPELTGRENIYLNGALLGMTRQEIQRKFDEIVAFAEVDQFLDTPVKRYSSGMYVRLAFAVAAHLEPEILIVDEVLAVGDAAFQKKCLGKMDAIARGGRTVLFVSHNLQIIQQLCKECLLLNKGRVDRRGTPDAVIQEYVVGGADARLSWSRQAPAAHSHVRSVRVCDARGQAVSTLTCADVLRLEIDCVVRENNPDMKLLVTLLDDHGRPVASTYPVDAGALAPVKKGCYQYGVAFPEKILLPRRYSVNVALYSHYGEVYDSLPNILGFEVTEVAAGDQCLDYNRWGVVFLPCTWDCRWTER